jgi:RNA polymerase sigma-70 factor (ECF subfamily)
MFLIEDLYEKYKQDIFIYLNSLTHNISLSEDLVSETFLSAITSLPNFKGNSDIKTWLFSIARYKWYEYLRKEKSTTPIDLFTESFISQEVSPETVTIQKEIRERISEILSKEDQRTSKIVMMRVEGYSFYEIAKQFNISEGSARVIDFRAKKKLRDVFIKEGFHYE